MRWPEPAAADETEEHPPAGQPHGDAVLITAGPGHLQGPPPQASPARTNSRQLPGRPVSARAPVQELATRHLSCLGGPQATHIPLLLEHSLSRQRARVGSAGHMMWEGQGRRLSQLTSDHSPGSTLWPVALCGAESPLPRATNNRVVPHLATAPAACWYQHPVPKPAGGQVGRQRDAGPTPK